MLGFSLPEIDMLKRQRGVAGLDRVVQMLRHNTHRLRSEMDHDELFNTLLRAAFIAVIALVERYPQLRQLGLSPHEIALVTRSPRGAMRLKALCELGPNLLASGLAVRHLIMAAREPHPRAVMVELTGVIAQYKVNAQGLCVDPQDNEHAFAMHQDIVVGTFFNALKTPNYWDWDG